MSSETAAHLAERLKLAVIAIERVREMVEQTIRIIEAEQEERAGHGKRTDKES